MATAFSPANPGRNEFGVEHYRYPVERHQGAPRLWVGTTRTIRPLDGETGSEFRARVDSLVAGLDPCGIIEVTVDEEIRAGVVVQATIRVVRSPALAAVSPDDHRVAGGRPGGPRGTRGGSGKH